MAESSQLETGSEKKHSTVIIAVDGSEYSDFSFQFYMESIHKPENRVIMAYSSEVKTTTNPAVALMSWDPALSMIAKEDPLEELKAQVLVEKLQKKIEELQIDGKIEHLHGEPGPVITNLAIKEHADYIVVGCRGKGTVRRTITGSVTDYITKHSHVPVLVTRHKDHIHRHGLHLSHNEKHEQLHCRVDEGFQPPYE